MALNLPVTKVTGVWRSLNDAVLAIAACQQSQPGRRERPPGLTSFSLLRGFGPNADSDISPPFGL